MPGRTGKTTLIQELIKQYKNDCKILNSDDSDVRCLLTDLNSTKRVPTICN